MDYLVGRCIMIIIPREDKIFPTGNKRIPIIANKKFVIVRTPKTGSCSFYYSFGHLNEDLLFLNMHMHDGIAALRNLYPKANYPNVKYIGISRNPYSKILSWYFHHLRYTDKREYPDNFTQFVNDNNHPTRMHCETKKYHLIDGRWAMDIMYCFEDSVNNIISDISNIFSVKNNGIKDKNRNPRIQVMLKKMSFDSRLSFLLNHPEAIDKIRENYKEDFEFYGYSMNPEDMMLPPQNHNIEYRRLQ